MKKLKFLVLIASISIFSCSSDDEDIDPIIEDLGVFEAQITGQINEKVKGEAGFVHGIITNSAFDENGSTMTLALINENNEDDIISCIIAVPGDTDGLNTGKYTVEIDPEDGEPIVVISATLNGTAYFNSVGEINFNSIQSTKITGDFTATLFDFAQQEIQVSGSFEALGATERL